MCRFDTFICCIMITTVASLNTLITSQNYNILFALGAIKTDLLAASKL